MSIYPGAVRKLIPASSRQPRIVPRAVIAHSAAGRGSLYGWWLNPQSNGLECHFWISEGGIIEQYVDSHVRADANGEANGYAISIETESSVQATERWNPRQADALVRLIDWICTEHRIPRRQMDAPTGSGLAWHVQFGAPGPWTKARGKTCPGPARIEQYRNEIIPAVAGTPTPPLPPKDTFLMALTDAQQKHLLDRADKSRAEYIDLWATVQVLTEIAAAQSGKSAAEIDARIKAFKAKKS